MNKLAQSNKKIVSGLFLTLGLVLIFTGAMTWMPIAYIGIIAFIAGLGIRKFMKM